MSEAELSDKEIEQFKRYKKNITKAQSKYYQKIKDEDWYKQRSKNYYQNNKEAILAKRKQRREKLKDAK